MKKRILIITTGGTIAMKFDKNFGVLPNNELIEMLHSFPQLQDVAEIKVHEFTNIPSPYMTPGKMFKLGKLIEEKIIDFDGIVITHGTDTLEETSYFLDLMLSTNKPVVLTAAMRSGSELGLDGPRNIVGAVRVASDELSVNRGVLVVMNDEINCARDVVKTDSGKTDAFETPLYGLLGIIDPDKIIFYRKRIIDESITTNEIETKIDLIKCVSGMGTHHLDASINSGVKAIVLEAFGRGNVPRSIVPKIQEAISKNIIIVIVSRTYTGRVLSEYGYEGGGKYLQKMGAILGGDLKGPKMRLKLMLLFGKLKTPDLVREYLKNEFN
ncbi:MAG: asparaginase [Candidatus Cloacimonetes bacterium]|nr:asparaginase [Candidatus Cloacimonadota bacterium]MCF7815218.1 asparaginase [Candidatus Cloacimonadota bacterium]MCF7869388.1 asparaginase [Candidatus Cloacimonadota bacterium]